MMTLNELENPACNPNPNSASGYCASEVASEVACLKLLYFV